MGTELEYDPAAQSAAEATKAADEAKEKAEAEATAAKAAEAVAAEKQQLVADRAAEKSAYDEKLAHLEGMLQERFAGKQAPPTEQPAPTTVPVATNDDFLTPDGARAAAERIAEEKAVEVGMKLDAEYRSEIQELKQDNFDTKLQALESRPYFKYVKEDLDKALKTTPELRTSPKALELLFNSLVGQASQRIVEEEKAAVSETHPEGPPPVDNRVMPEISQRRSNVASPSGPVTPEEAGPGLDDHEEAMRAKFARAGVRITADRWAEIRDSRRRAPGSDIPSMEDRGR